MTEQQKKEAIKYIEGQLELRIIYNKEGYQILFDSSETEIYINANNIVEARQHFVDGMAQLFDCAVNERLQKTFDEQMEDVKRVVDDAPHAVMRCTYEIDHDWEYRGASTNGTYYKCKNCNITKVYPYEDDGNEKINILRGV